MIELFDYASQPKVEVAQCNLCLGSKFVRVAERDRYGFPATADACTACGLVFLNPRMTREGYQAFYAGPYRALITAYSGPKANAKSLRASQAVYAVDLGKFLGPFIAGRVLTLLDIGGSTGIVARHLAERFGLEATILDPAASEIAEAPDLQVVQGFAEDWEPTQSYDLGLLCQTVDHLLDIRLTLMRLRRACRWVFVDFVDCGKGVQFKLDHPYYLTNETMLGYLHRAGFDVVAGKQGLGGRHMGFLCR